MRPERASMMGLRIATTALWAAESDVLSAKLFKDVSLKTYRGAPHDIPATHADQVNANLLAFLLQG